MGGSSFNVTLEIMSPGLEPKVVWFKVMFYNSTTKNLYNVDHSNFYHAYEGVDCSILTNRFVKGPNRAFELTSQNEGVVSTYESYLKSITVRNKNETGFRDCRRIKLFRQSPHTDDKAYLHHFCIMDSIDSFFYERKTVGIEESFTKFIKLPFMKPDEIKLLLEFKIVIFYFLPTVKFQVNNNLLQIFALDQALNFVRSIPLDFIPRKKNFMYYGSNAEILVFVDHNESILHSVKAILKPCCSLFEESHTKIQVAAAVQRLEFYNQNIFYIFYQDKCEISAMKFQFSFSSFSYEIIPILKECYSHSYLIGVNQKIVLFRMQTSQILQFYLPTPLLPIYHSKIPLFYQNLKFFNSHGNIKSMPYHNGFLLLLQDEEERIVASLYEMTYSLAQSLHFATYLTKPDGSYFTAQDLLDTPFLEFAFSQDQAQQLYGFMIYDETTEIEIIARKNDFFLIHPELEEGNQFTNYSLTITPGKDSLTNKQIQFYSLDKPRESFELQVFILKSGLLVENNENGSLKLYVTQTNSSQSLSSLFNGNFLIYYITCSSPQICGNTTDHPISYKQPYSIASTMISENFKKRSIRRVFMWEIFSIVVDDQDIVYLMYRENEKARFYLIEEMNQNNLAHVTYIFPFKSEVYSNQTYSSIWMVEGLDTEDEVLVHAFFKASFSTRTKAVQFKELRRVSTNFLISQARFSEHWNRVIISSTRVNKYNNKLFIYKLTLINGIPELSGAQIDSNYLHLSPFMISCLQIHDQLPIILLGLTDFGVIAFHIYNLEIIFVIDFKVYLYDNYILSYLRNQNKVQVSAILQLNQQKLGFIVNQVGLMLVQIHFSFDLGFIVDDYIVIIEQDSDNFIYAPNKKHQITQSDRNWLLLRVSDFYFNYYNPFTFTVFYLSSYNYAIWLDYITTTSEWYINVFNNYNIQNSKEYLSFLLTVAPICHQLTYNPLVQNSLTELSVFVFCIDEQGNDILYEVYIQVSHILTLNAEKLKKSTELNSINLEVHARNYYGSIRKSVPIELRIGEEEPEYEGGIYGLLLTIAVIILVMFVFCVSREIRHYLEDKKQNALDLKVQEAMRSMKLEDIDKMLHGLPERKRRQQTNESKEMEVEMERFRNTFRIHETMTTTTEVL